MKRMREKDIPAFVQEVAATGCDICAIGPGLYVLGDVDVPRGKRRGLYKKLREIDARYGSRDHLRHKIASHLTSIGRYINARSLESEAWVQFPASGRKIDDEAPNLAAVTAYDVAHLGIYAAMLVAEADGADWSDVARVTLNIDPNREPERARRAWASHLARARWLATSDFREIDLLQ
ncbi:conserved hypothetical protein [Mesorhizobium plurifarium]|uniref:Uncharacterized protein n=1 Tax=Mesorhizobium plurifarium TaxID=69974 RepID=A0A090E3I4_MESPL|nr:conserved hypothetical protein [Mesorhizobium plurifarium]